MEMFLAAITPQTIDAVAVLFVIVFALNGLAKGFTKLFFKVFGSLLGLLFAVLLCTSVTNFLQSEFSFVTTMSANLEGALTKIFGAGTMETTLEEATSERLSSLGLGSWLTSIILSFAGDASIPTDTTLNEIICPTFAYYVVMVISIVGLFIVFKILFFLISAFVKKLHNIKVVAVLDRTLGAVLGFLSGVIYLELILMIIGVLPIPFMQEIASQISATGFVAFVQEISLYQVVLNAISSANIIGHVKAFIGI